ncbi:hypothetical protein D3OALGA1CA_95 [Olavius algarvensis associated proteobacterium Delta 3]|nr:hypothetical protein D3OALGA1CA_95 [Olavius algarvensis associated proteobacterium Delta 3]
MAGLAGLPVDRIAGLPVCPLTRWPVSPSVRRSPEGENGLPDCRFHLLLYFESHHDE